MEKGISLIELIITLAILSIISALSIPPMKRFIAQQSVIADVRLIINTINTARNKSITLREPLKICGYTTTDTCSSNWRKLKVTAINQKTVLHTLTLQSDYKHVHWSAFQHKPGLTINTKGFTHHQNGTLYLCHNLYPSLHRAVVVSKSGKTSVKQDSSKLQSRCG
ncbi:pilus assembly FimT family protein [Kangiella shandongensis]|uniref:pilus assembly FimT family protein n=1 Tax=Kangiella shandongensis TaxID=2763258 RepID=UPI001CBC6332|nr:GspH/FimT family pseudopilin [Kangiella shandongensis]